MNSTFELEYERVAIKDRNLFYFENYCLDTKEFKEWLNYNKLYYCEYENLNEELKRIYLGFKSNHIQTVFKRIIQRYRNSRDNIYLERLYTFYMCEEPFIKILSEYNDYIEKIYNFYKNNNSIISYVWSVIVSGREARRGIYVDVEYLLEF